MTTLITGAGLVGASFAQVAIKRSEPLIFLDSEPRKSFLRLQLGTADFEIFRKDIRDLPALIQLINDHHIDTIVHTAGLIGKRVEESLYTGFQINLGGTLNIAEAVRLTGVKRLVHISTSGVYDLRREPTTPVRETFPRGGGGGYGNLKVAKEVLLEAYQRLYGFELIILRPAGVFGLGHFWSGSRVGQKMQTILQSGLKGNTATIPQKEAVANEYIYAKDLGKAIDLAASVPMPSETVFNIGNGKITPFESIIEAVKKFLPGVNIEVAPGGAPPKPKTQPLDISQAKQHLGWSPIFSLEAALQDYVQDLTLSNRQKDSAGQE